jgi:hypothetical protein
MARGWTPKKAFTGTPDEVDFCPPICLVRHIYFLWKKRECLKALVFWRGYFAVIRTKTEKTITISIHLNVFFSPEGRLQNLLNQINRCLTKTIKAILENSTFWFRDFSQTQLKKEAHCCLKQSRLPLILNYLGKRKEKLRIGEKDCYPGLSCQRQ